MWAWARPLKGKRSVPLLVLVPHATLVFLASSQAAGSAAAAAGAFFCTAWVSANLVCEVGKKVTGRQRPCVALRKELDLVPRRLPQLQVRTQSRVLEVLSAVSPQVAKSQQ